MAGINWQVVVVRKAPANTDMSIAMHTGLTDKFGLLRMAENMRGEQHKLAAKDLKLPAVFPGIRTEFLEDLQLQNENKGKE